MEKKSTTLSLAVFLCSLSFSHSAFAMAFPTLPEPVKETPTLDEDSKTAETNNVESLDNETTSNQESPANEETAQVPESTIVSVTPYEMFVTDQLFVFLHSGSSNRYRIIGRVAASESVSIISKDDSTGWLEVKLQDNKTGWIDSTMLVNNAGVKAKLATANEKIKELNTKISKLGSVSTDDLTALEVEITELTNANEQLKAQLNLATDETKTLQASIKQSDETKRILAKLYDVGAVVIGVFVGWILTRRKKNQWV